nr:WD repeat-containing protein 76 [Ipomoea batatas]
MSKTPKISHITASFFLSVSFLLSLMAPSQKLTDYERRKLENIKRNEEMLAALKIHSRLSDLSAATKRPRVKNKSYKLSSEKKQKSETPIVLRRSLRKQGKPPDDSVADGLKVDFDESIKKNKLGLQSSLKKLPTEPVPINMKDAFSGENNGSNQQLIETIKGLSRKSQLDENVNQEPIFCDLKKKRRPSGSVDIESLRLEPENIARVVRGRILNVKCFPTNGMRMVVVGNMFGDIGFWNADAKEEDGDGIYLYQLHSAPVSGIVIESFSMSKMYTCSHDGFIRLMDIEKELFDSLYFSDYPICALSQRPDDMNSLYYAEGNGKLGIWDLRAGKSSSSWSLHEDRINSIDFNLADNYMLATGSTDGTACIWDMRNAGAIKPRSLRTVRHKRAVQSAYFSRSGTFLATTSYDDKIGFSCGANYEAVCMLRHQNNHSFRAIWGWDDSYVFIGNKQKGVDVISTYKMRTVSKLQSEHVSAIQWRLDAHQYEVGMLAGATGGGQVCLWTPS